MWVSFKMPCDEVSAPDVMSTAIYSPAFHVVQVYGLMTGIWAYQAQTFALKTSWGKVSSAAVSGFPGALGPQHEAMRHPSAFWAGTYCCVSRSISPPSRVCEAVSDTWKLVRNADPRASPYPPPPNQNPHLTNPQGVAIHTEVWEALGWPVLSFMSTWLASLNAPSQGAALSCSLTSSAPRHGTITRDVGTPSVTTDERYTELFSI